MRKDTLEEHESRVVMRDIVRGMVHLQEECKVMHRDIKLDNVMVKRTLASATKHQRELSVRDFEFKVGDMGLAKTHSGDNLEKGTICGSPLYMAPELLTR